MIHQACELLYREAELLDEGRFDEWLALLAPDLRYWAPSRADLPRAEEAAGEAVRLALFDETRESIALRLKRLQTGLAWSETPPSRTRRHVGNVRVQPLEGARLRVRSYLLVFRSRSPDDETLLSAERDDVWSRSDGWLLHERRIVVDHRTVDNLSLLL